MMRALGFFVSIAVVAAGALLLDVGVDGVAHYGLILLGIIVFTLFDYENFYGDGRSRPRRS